jgi:uncharacterized protein YodC (DUF2158 family)
MSQFNQGDVVKMKSGGRAMTVLRISGEIVYLTYIHKGEIKQAQCHDSCIEKVKSAECSDLALVADELSRLRGVAEDKEQKLTQVGLILHAILGTIVPPTIINGVDCIDLAERVRAMLSQR